MLPVERDAAYLWDMLDYSHLVCDFTSGMTFDSYQRDRKLQLAVERAVEIVGEAARNVSAEFQGAHPEIPWRSIIAQRNILAHEYGEIKQERMWLLLIEHLPVLVQNLEKLIPPIPPE